MMFTMKGQPCGACGASSYNSYQFVMKNPTVDQSIGPRTLRCAGCGLIASSV